jgi:hypothetical protein
MRPERVLRRISRDADYNAPGRAGQPQRQPDAAESAAYLQGVERARLLRGRSRGQLKHWFSEY